MIFNKINKYSRLALSNSQKFSKAKKNISSNSSKKSGLKLTEGNNFLDKKIVFGFIYYLKI